MLLYVDDVFDSIFSVLRGTSFLLDVLSNVDAKILPGDITKNEVRKRKKVLMKIMNAYLNKYVPNRLKLFKDEEDGMEIEKAWVVVKKCLDLQLTEENNIDYMKLYDEWREENKFVIDEIGKNYLYNRDVPRKGKLLINQWRPDSSEAERHKLKIRERAGRRKKRRQERRNKQHND